MPDLPLRFFRAQSNVAAQNVAPRYRSLYLTMVSSLCAPNWETARSVLLESIAGVLHADRARQQCEEGMRLLYTVVAVHASLPPHRSFAKVSDVVGSLPVPHDVRQQLLAHVNAQVLAYGIVQCVAASEFTLPLDRLPAMLDDYRWQPGKQRECMHRVLASTLEAVAEFRCAMCEADALEGLCEVEDLLGRAHRRLRKAVQRATKQGKLSSSTADAMRSHVELTASDLSRRVMQSRLHELRSDEDGRSDGTRGGARDGSGAPAVSSASAPVSPSVQTLLARKAYRREWTWPQSKRDRMLLVQALDQRMHSEEHEKLWQQVALSLTAGDADTSLDGGARSHARTWTVADGSWFARMVRAARPTEPQGVRLVDACRELFRSRRASAQHDDSPKPRRATHAASGAEPRLASALRTAASALRSVWLLDGVDARGSAPNRPPQYDTQPMCPVALEKAMTLKEVRARDSHARCSPSLDQ